jgi:hypothetical protein
MPDDPDADSVQTAIYAATLDEIEGGVRGVAEIPVDGGPVRALGARGPTRLVAAARLRERKPDSPASDASAFDGQRRVPRVYAVLDESGCGPGRPIDCGLVSLDPDPALPPGPDAIPADWAGRMPYRAPIVLPGRPLVLAVAGPPAEPPSADPADAVYQDAFMRLFAGPTARVTTAVGLVPTDDGGRAYVLDLGRFALASTVASPILTQATVAEGAYDDQDRRLWIQKEDGTFAATTTEASAEVTVTPGYTTDEAWTVTYQGVLPELGSRAAEAGTLAGGDVWLALQLGDGPAAGPRTLNEVVRVHHPSIGVAAGDLVVIQARAIDGCAGTLPPGSAEGSAAPREFEVVVAEVLPPDGPYPGGAVRLVPPVAGTDPEEWVTCFDALEAAIASSDGVATGLLATVRSGGLMLVGSRAGYAGRPRLGERYVLEYPSATDEDALAALCPLADWDGALPADPAAVTCGGLPCDRAVCESLVLARKARRYHHVSEDCGTDQACIDRWAAYDLPVANGPTLGFRVGVQPAGATAARGMAIRLQSISGAVPLSARAASGSQSNANGAVAFDRSAYGTPAAGYRFLVSYPADQVLDVTPSVNPPEALVIR